MTVHVLRAAGAADLPTLYEMAKGTGGGFTNLPPDRRKLAEKLDSAGEAFERAGCGIADDKFMFVLGDDTNGRVSGTCQIFSRIGASWPFYSYRIDAFAQYSRELDRTVRAELLTLCTDHSGCTEVGGLYLNASDRAAGVGALLARSRYLFIGMHRERFADRTIAELRGVVDDDGQSSFWDAVGGRFFDMTFRDADGFNAVHGNQFIADLMPKTSIYKAMLGERALAVLGMPHPTGRPAMRMLEKEGFVFDRYVDIFDGGPTMSVETDRIATIRKAKEDVVLHVAQTDGGVASIVAAGRLAGWRSTFGNVASVPGGVVLEPAVATALRVSPGDRLTHVPR